MKKLISICLSFLIFCLSFTANGFAAVNFPVSVRTSQPISATSQNNFKITDSFISADNNKTIIFIQDLHGSISAQKNISKTIKAIEKEYNPEYLFIEGLPYGENDISILNDIKKYNITGELLKENLLTGPEYYLINNNTKMKIAGLENFDIYLQNIERAADIIENTDYIKETYTGLKNEIYKKIPKSKILKNFINPELSNNKILSRINQPVIKYKNLHDYLCLTNNIKNLNLKKAEKEYKKFLKELKSNLNFAEYNTIIKYSAHGNTDKYYSALYDEMLKYKYADKYNNLRKMLEYFKQKNGLNMISFISQKDMYFNDFLNSDDIQNEKEIFILKMTQLFENFLSLSISYDEYIFFTNNYQRYINLLSKYLSESYYEYEDLFSYDKIFDYHWTNVERNNIFINNILSKLNYKNNKKQTAIVVSGGFHSSILKQLKDKDISYILITPEINNDINNNTYNEILVSSLTDSFDEAALAPIKIITAGMRHVPYGIKDFFFVNLTKIIFKQKGTLSEKDIKKRIEETGQKIFKKDVFVSIEEIPGKGTEIKAKCDDRELTINISPLKEKNQKQIKKQKYSGIFHDLLTNFIAFIKRTFNIFQSTSMRLNPKSRFSSSWISKRLGKRNNFMFTRSMFYSLIKDYDKSYDLMMGFAHLKKVKSTTYAINCDTDLDEQTKASKGFKAFAGKTVDIIVENELVDKIDKDKIIQILSSAIKRVDSPSPNIKDTLFIGILDKSTNLFEDHLNNGFIGVNEGILYIEDKTVKQAVLEAGLIHEISHEIQGPLNTTQYRSFEEKMMFADIKFIIEFVAREKYGKDSDINKILFTDRYYQYIIKRIQNALLKRSAADGIPLFTRDVRFIRKLGSYRYNIKDIVKFFERKDMLDDEREGQRKHIEDEYFKTYPETQQIFFSALHKAADDNLTIEDFFNKYISEKRKTEIDTRINKLTNDFRNMLSLSSLEQNEIDKKVKDFRKNIQYALKIMYNEIPSYLFERYLNERVVVAEHSLNHSLDVLDAAIQILGRDRTAIETTDFKAVIFAAMFHDISCSILRLNHEQNSATWARAILNRYLQNSYKYMSFDDKIHISPEDIEKIYYICLGHKKTKNGIPRTEHERYFEAKLIHDADGLAATLNLQRILSVWVKMGETFFNPNISIETRIKLIKENKYLQIDGGDAINDLLRQFIRRDPSLYLTSGAREKIGTSKSYQHALHNFIMSPETKKFLHENNINLTDELKEKIIKIFDETLSVFIENYQKYGNKNAPEQAVVLNEENESVFGFKSRITLIFKIIYNKFNSTKNIFKQNIAISDIHGGYARFAELLINLLDSTYDTSLKQDMEINDDIIERIRINMNNNTFYLLGDLLDRGDRQVEAFELTKRIADTGNMKFITGNHDLYAFMNLLGLHLPFYKNYKGIKDDYIDFKGRNVKSLLEMLNDILSKQDASFDIRAFWAEQLYKYMKYSDEQQKNIWSKEESELQQLFHKTFGFELDKKGKDILNNPDKFLENSDSADEIKMLFKNKLFINFHKKFFGRNVGVVVYTGIRAANKMSINWWLDRKQELKELKHLFPQYAPYWRELETVINKIIDGQKNKFEEEEKKYININKGDIENVVRIKNLAWGIIDAIMYRNYESTEWNALDWVYHQNWGGGEKGFLAQRNKQLTAQGEKPINQVTYFKDTLINDLMHFYQDNFFLYRVDEYGFYYMHSLLPVDDDGDVSIGYVDEKGVFHERDQKGKRIKGFYYKGKQYKGHNIFKGLHLIAEDIRNYDISSNNLSEIMEAFTLITAVYADNTTRIKPANLKELKAKYGSFNPILVKMGVTTIIAGHNPVEKLDNQFEFLTIRFFNKEFKILNLMHIDGNMSSGYAPPKGKGLYSEIGGGIFTRGFISGDATEITASTVPDVSRKVFVSSVILNLFPALRKILAVTEKIYNKINLYRQHLNAHKIKLFNTTFINILNNKYDLEKTEAAHLKNLDTISISAYENISGVHSEVQNLDIERFYFDNMEVSVEITLHKILTARGNIPVISFKYNKTAGIDYTELDRNIIEYIIEQIKDKAYKKFITAQNNILICDDLNGKLKPTTKLPDLKFTFIIKKYFGFMPALYDVNTFRHEHEIYDITKMNTDDLRSLLAAS